MAHPNAVVFQEDETINPTVVQPALPACIVGPAYHLRDYVDDKATIEVESYGALNGDNPVSTPVANTPAITLVAMPDNVAGGVVVPSSISVIFDDARVVMVDASDGEVTTDDNLLTSSGSTFITDGVQAGDTLIIDNPAGPATPSIVRTVRSVVSETTLRVTTNFVATQTLMNFRIERHVNDAVVDSVYVVPPVDPDIDPTVILGDVHLTVGGASRLVTYARVYVAYRALRTDLQRLDSATTQSEIQTKIGRIDARNPLAGLVSVARQNAGDGVPVYFYGIPTDDIAGYTTALDDLAGELELYAFCYARPEIAVAALFRTSVLQGADPNYAIDNGTPQRFRVAMGSESLVTDATITDATLTGTTQQAAGATPPSGTKTAALAGATLLSDGVVPGDLLILTNSSNTAFNGTYTIAHLNSQTELEVDTAFPSVATVGANWRIYRPSLATDVVSEVESRASLTNQGIVYTSKVGGAAAGARTIELVADATTPGGINQIVETVGATTRIFLDTGAGTITRAAVVAALNSGTGVTVPFVGSVNLVASTTTPALFVSAALFSGSPGTGVALSTDTVGVDTLASSALDAAYTQLFDSAATFITNGVIPGDTIEIPLDPLGVFDVDDEVPVRSFVVDTVHSEQLLSIVNAVSGAPRSNTSTREYELPHLDSRLGLGPAAGDVTPGPVRYRIMRHLTKDQQVTTLAALPASLASSRNLLCWPDLSDVTGLVDGSLPRGADNLPALAGEQSGSYYAAALAGATSGLPPHQGLSTRSLVGVTIPESRRRYFKPEQISALADAGWVCMIQATENSLPTVFHQLTTDPSSLESGEYSIVRTKDYVSKAFLATIQGFRGQWNNIPETHDFMRIALVKQGDLLKAQRYAKIGAPLIAMNISSVGESAVAADFAEAFITVRIPGPLNVVVLHLVFGLGA